MSYLVTTVRQVLQSTLITCRTPDGRDAKNNGQDMRRIIGAAKDSWADVESFRDFFCFVRKDLIFLFFNLY